MSPAAGRRAAIFEFLARHTATLALLALTFFRSRTAGTSKKKCSRWLVKWRRRGRILVAGAFFEKGTGRPQIAYGRRCKPAEVEHEVRVAELELRYFRDTPFERDVKVGKANPDAVMERDGIRYAIEVDHSGKMTAQQMEAKWKRYVGTGVFILVVCRRESRMQRLRAGASLVKDRAFFTTWERLESDAEPWVDFHGHTIKV
jgi:hypothetical protein